MRCDMDAGLWCRGRFSATPSPRNWLPHLAFREMVSYRNETSHLPCCMAGQSDVLSGTFAGRYTIERELGHGASATVYLARDTHRGRHVAIKVLRPELAQSIGADRFLREIRLNEQLHHPHIVPILDSGEHDGQLFFV